MLFTIERIYNSLETANRKLQPAGCNWWKGFDRHFTCLKDFPRQYNLINLVYKTDLQI